MAGKMNTVRRLCGWLGGFATAAALALATTLWTPWIQANRATIVNWLISLGLLSLFCFLAWLLLSSRTSGKPAVLDVPKFEPQQNSPSNSSASSNGNVINFFGTSPLPQVVGIVPKPPKQAETCTPQLILRFGTTTLVFEDDHFQQVEDTVKQRWHEDALIVEVTNQPASNGGLACRARSVVVRVAVKCGEMNSGVDRAYWVGYDENQIDLDVGTSAHVVLGVIENGNFMTYDNRNPIPLIQMNWPSPFQPRVRRGFPDAHADLISGDIYLLSLADPLSVKTLVHKKFSVKFDRNKLPPAVSLDWTS